MRRPCLLLLAASLTACQPRGTAPPPAAAPSLSRTQAAPAARATACAEPWGSGPFTPAGPPLSAPPITPPPRAAADHVTGCAGLRFRIGPDGAPTDIEVLVEAPAGYGLGQAAAQALAAARWARRDDGSYHYISRIIPD